MPNSGQECGILLMRFIIEKNLSEKSTRVVSSFIQGGLLLYSMLGSSSFTSNLPPLLVNASNPPPLLKFASSFTQEQPPPPLFLFNLEPKFADFI